MSERATHDPTPGQLSVIYNGNNEYLVRLFDAGDHDILFSAFVKGEELARALTGNLGKCGFVAYPVDSGGDA